MSYYVFKYENTDFAKLQELKLLSEFETFKAASKYSKEQRASQLPDDREIIKVIFAENVFSAEEQIREKRLAQPGDD